MKTAKTEITVVDFINKSVVISVTVNNTNSKADKAALMKVNDAIVMILEMKHSREVKVA